MYVCQLSFECLVDLDISQAQSAISALLDEYRYNGQIIGREFPVILVDDHFDVIFVTPEQDSVAVKYNNNTVTQAFEAISQVGLALPSFKLLGLESQSDFSDQCHAPTSYVLYSTFVQSCSPVRCLEHFAPVPLYKLPENIRYDLVKWQESQAACDQLQMNEMIEVEPFMIEQLSDPSSELMLKGLAIGQRITEQLSVPMYRYLYRVGGESLRSEQARLCPGCGHEWALPNVMHNLFDFKCDDCLLVSNISWDWQS